MKQPKSRQEKMFTMTASSKAADVVERLAELPADVVERLAGILKDTVTGIKGSSYREVCYTILWLAENPGQDPPWLVGNNVLEQTAETDPEAAAFARLKALGLLS